MNIRTSAFRGLATLSLAALGLAACEGKDTINIPEQVNPVEVTVAPTQVTLAVGQKAALAAVVKNSTNQAVTWSCAPTTVVTLSGTEVTAAAPGSAVCTATAAADANAKGVVSITVTAPVITLSVLPTTATINSVAPGNTIQLGANVSGSTNQNVTWASNATGVATVSATGLVTAVAPGTAVVTATSAADANVKASSVITVSSPVIPPVVITLQPATANTTIGGTVQLVPNVTGTTNTAVTYRSSDATVATVTAAGLVTGVKGGTAVISAIAAADTTKKATAVITVAGAAPVASISIASVVDHATGAPVDPAAISGQIDVTVNVSAVPENGVMAVAVYVDSQQVCRQNFTNPLGTTQGVATINCPVNTAEYDATTFVPKFMDGTHTISAKALGANDAVITSAMFCPVGAGCTVTFDNASFIGAISNNCPTMSGTWATGTCTATIKYVQYETTSAASVPFGLNTTCSGTTNTGLNATGSGATYTLNWSVSNATYTGACVQAGTKSSATFNYDTQAPSYGSAPASCSSVYFNGTKTFTWTASDAGVGFGETYLTINSGSTVLVTGATGTTSASVSTATLPETATNTGYTVVWHSKDALGNTATAQSACNFGIDVTAPTVSYTKTYNGANIATNTATDSLAYPIIFTFTYSDAATPPAGPAGFNPNPVTYSIVRYAADAPTGTTVESGSVNNTFDLNEVYNALPALDGYYVVNATVTDAAGNTWTMPTFTILVDNAPPFIGTLTVPSTLTGGAAFTMSADITDNVDLGEGWATIGYTNAQFGLQYFIIQNKTDLGAYGLPLNTAQTLGTLTIPSVIRSIREIDPTDNLAGDTVYTAKVAEYAILDVAGETIPTACPAEPAADNSTTANCRVRTADIGPAYMIGNPTGATYSFPLAGVIGLGTPGAMGFTMDTNTTAIDAVVTGAAQTFNNPFTAVYFYGVDAQGRAHFLGTGSVSVTDDTILQIRTWRYTLSSSWSSAYAPYVNGVFALVVGPNGDALVTVTEAHP